jgi:hypothetical protein
VTGSHRRDRRRRGLRAAWEQHPAPSSAVGLVVRMELRSEVAIYLQTIKERGPRRKSQRNLTFIERKVSLNPMASNEKS